MSHPVLPRPAALEPLNRLRDLLALLAAVRGLGDPLTTERGLRAALELLARLAELLGIDPAWIERVRLVLANEHVFRIVLAIVQYVSSLIGEEAAADEIRNLGVDGLSLDEQSLIQWLPLVLELLNLWRRLRGV